MAKRARGKRHGRDHDANVAKQQIATYQIHLRRKDHWHVHAVDRRQRPPAAPFVASRLGKGCSIEKPMVSPLSETDLQSLGRRAEAAPGRGRHGSAGSPAPSRPEHPRGCRPAESPRGNGRRRGRRHRRPHGHRGGRARGRRTRPSWKARCSGSPRASTASAPSAAMRSPGNGCSRTRPPPAAPIASSTRSARLASHASRAADRNARHFALPA